MYYHVVVVLKDDPKKSVCLFSDLSESDLRKKFVKLYHQGKSILANGSVVDTMAIRTTAIRKTASNSNIELAAVQEASRRHLDELNGDYSGVVFLSPGRGYAPEDIEDAGEDITAQYIKDAPGSKRNGVPSTVMNHPWMTTLLGGVIVTVIGALVVNWLPK